MSLRNFSCFQATTNPSLPAQQKSCNVLFPLARKSYEKEPPAQRVFRIFIASHWKGLLNSSYCLFLLWIPEKLQPIFPQSMIVLPTDWLFLWVEVIHSTLLKCRVAVVRGVRCASAVLSFASNVAPNFLSTASNTSPPLPSSCGWSSIERPADTVATYRAGGQLAFTRLNLKLLPSFTPYCCCCC